MYTSDIATAHAEHSTGQDRAQALKMRASLATCCAMHDHCTLCNDHASTVRAALSRREARNNILPNQTNIIIITTISSSIMYVYAYIIEGGALHIATQDRAQALTDVGTPWRRKLQRACMIPTMHTNTHNLQ
jgi:hypothetical protein